MTAASGHYRYQDGQVVNRDHVQRQWDRRAPPAWRGVSVRAAWREGYPVDPETAGSSDAGVYKRYHAASGMLLVAQYGFLQTAVRVGNLERSTTTEGTHE